MAYSRAFFAVKLTFADRLIERFGIDLSECLYEYTNFRSSLNLGGPPYNQTNPVWREYIAGLAAATDKLAWTYDFFLEHQDDDPEFGATASHDQPLFGPFQYGVRDGHIIRPHMVKLRNDPSPHGVLSRHRADERRADLKSMFAHIKERETGIDTVLGNSWMYNLEAYRRIYPPAYTKRMAVSPHHEFQFLALWGQFFDRHWHPKADLVDTLYSRLERLDDLADLRHCFPYQILRPECPIERFYSFYDL